MGHASSMRSRPSPCRQSYGGQTCLGSVASIARVGKNISTRTNEATRVDSNFPAPGLDLAQSNLGEQLSRGANCQIETFDPEIRIAYVGGDCGFGSHCTVGGMRNCEILGSEQNESGSSRASFRLPSTASETERGGAVRCVIVGRFNPFSSLPSMTFQLARRSQKVDLVVARAG